MEHEGECVAIFCLCVRTWFKLIEILSNFGKLLIINIWTSLLQQH